TADGLVRKLPIGDGIRTLSVLAPGEALLLGGCDHSAVDHERGGGVVEDGVETQHGGHVTPVSPYQGGGVPGRRGMKPLRRARSVTATTSPGSERPSTRGSPCPEAT